MNVCSGANWTMRLTDRTWPPRDFRKWRRSTRCGHTLFLGADVRSSRCAPHCGACHFAGSKDLSVVVWTRCSLASASLLSSSTCSPGRCCGSARRTACLLRQPIRLRGAEVARGRRRRLRSGIPLTFTGGYTTVLARKTYVPGPQQGVAFVCRVRRRSCDA
jgi:hypothetical protein